ncbi:aminoacylase-1-like [Aricia agestis]|uniref:aminoacylase-1-like n=1 Tax=Aricia agestis TaxID=91739 RepID=UPI001C20429A|nr:aminoacylase-1-like [Aricia agestis]
MWKLSCVVFCAVAVNCMPVVKRNAQEYANISAVQRLQEYLRIDTSDGKNLDVSTEFWHREALALGLEFNVYSPAGLPVVVMTWNGTEPELPSIMLNTHADVVPVYESEWTYPPFSAHIDENGDMYARGTQDTKSVAIQYIEAIRRLIENGVTVRRTLHVTVMPDEEVGGDRGMRAFIKTDEFKSLNVGFVMDEGLASPDDTLYATYVDKRPWQMEITIHENSGHPSSLPEKDIVTKLQTLLNMTANFRKDQVEIKKALQPLDFGSYGTLNINRITGGIANNVIPSTITVIVDVRLAMSTTATEAQQMVDTWTRALGNGTKVKFIRKIDESVPTAIDDSNQYWVAIKDAANDLGLKILPIVCPATSDMIYVRSLGIPALGFAPKIRTINRLHDHDEYLPVPVFLQGIDIYVAILMRIANLQ